MKRTGLLMAAAAVFCGSAHAVTPVDPFDEGLKLCAAKDAEAIVPGMAALHATALTDDEIDRVRMGQVSGYALALLRSGRDQGSVGTDPYPVPEYMGWSLGRVTVLVATQAGQAGALCTVFAPYDRYDAAVSTLSAGLGAPAKTLTFGGHRLAAWELASGTPYPGAQVVTGDFGGERKPTTVQVLIP